MSDARPFRFGLAVTGDVSSREEWIGLARRAEDMGYATLLVADHYVNEYPPIAALMAVGLDPFLQCPRKWKGWG